MNYNLPSINYPYNALEPYIDEETMKIHHLRHHKNYVDRLISIVKENNISYSVEELMLNLNKIRCSKFVLMRNNLGGHVNHSFFWNCLKKDVQIPTDLDKILTKNFGSIECFKKNFENVAVSHFGSGWVWLIKDKNKKLHIVSTKNQDHPMMGKDFSGVRYGIPILTLDVWEHAYYLKYKNKRVDYVKAFWKLINWENVLMFFEST